MTKSNNNLTEHLIILSFSGLVIIDVHSDYFPRVLTLRWHEVEVWLEIVIGSRRGTMSVVAIIAIMLVMLGWASWQRIRAAWFRLSIAAACAPIGLCPWSLERTGVSIMVVAAIHMVTCSHDWFATDRHCWARGAISMTTHRARLFLFQWLNIFKGVICICRWVVFPGRVRNQMILQRKLSNLLIKSHQNPTLTRFQD